MNKKNIIIISCVALVLISLSTVTYAYFKTGLMGNITGNTGSVNLVVNGANANASERFSVTLKRSETEQFVIPGDSGYFDLNVNATGSAGNVAFSLAIDRSNLPLNLKFYVDEDHTKEVNNQSYKISKAETMVKTVRIYWSWADIDDANDSLFIGKNITASIVVSAELAKPTFSETLLAQSYILDTNVNFGSGSSSTNGIGLMMRDGTQNDEYPIVYYRGDVSNNNVIFADFCWLIVRTTETGGVKLIYNGEVNEDGSCNNTNYTDVYAAKDAFNTTSNSPVYAGYMYNDANTYLQEGKLGIMMLDSDGYKTHLTDNSIDSETGRHTQNVKDSTIKGVVDNWYKANILGKPEESLLEDTIWCNDRSVISETFSIENYAENGEIYFAAYTRLAENTTVTPSLSCARDMDKFTVDSANGNGDLDYPIGLLTADEINLAGHPYNDPETTYLQTDGYVLSLSPGGLDDSGACAFYVFGDYLESANVDDSGARVRPSVSLGLGATITGGDGSYQSPYRVG